MSRSNRALALVFLGVLAAGVARTRAQGGQVHEGQYAQADIIKGQATYRAQCSTCHGVMGQGVGGVDLRRGVFKTVRSDEDLMRVVSTGVGNGMPAFKFDQAEMTGIVAFIRAGFDLAGAAVRLGDPQRGRQLFAGKGGCASCHRVNGEGGGKGGPDLSDVGSARTLGTLQGMIVDPATYLLPINRSVRAVTRDGKVIIGRRLNEDTYWVQLLDENDRLLSLEKSQLKEYKVLTTPRMPPFKDKFSTEEVADLVAYLASLKG
jgi:putative heme-binding domain-containing protein